MIEELKPCPFCGGNGKLIESHRYDASVDSTPPHWKVSCECVGCNGAAINIWRQSEEEALKAWNHRVEPEDINRMRDLLEDVVNALDLSEIAVETHGPLGTEPAELVKLVLQQKDREIALLHHELDGLPVWFVDAVNERINELQAHCDTFRDIPSENDTIVHATFLIRELYGLFSLRKPKDNAPWMMT